MIRRAVSRVLAMVDERQEAEQRARQQVLVDCTDGPPRLAQYLGQGRWKVVSVAAMRIAISFGRTETPSADARQDDRRGLRRRPRGCCS